MLGDIIGDILGEVPSHQTIIDWAVKCGLALYSEKGQLTQPGRAMIVDDSVNMNGQVLHLELETAATHPGHALGYRDVNVARMVVGKNWDTKKTVKQLRKCMERYKAAYITTDNSRVLAKAIGQLKIPHHRDITHSCGMYIERVYGGTEELEEFNRQMGLARKYSHTEIGCLQPPQQRAHSRFLNLFDRVDWAVAVRRNFRRLPKRGKKAFAFVKEQAPFIGELKVVMNLYELIQQLIKEEGLSHRTAAIARDSIKAALMCSDNARHRKLGQYLLDYFTQEESLLESDEAVHNICSDVIESTFGYIKSRLSSNKNYGFTKLILLIPVQLRTAGGGSYKLLNIRENMFKTRYSDLDKWSADHLLPSPFKRRASILQTS